MTPELQQSLMVATNWDFGAEAIGELVRAGADPNGVDPIDGSIPLFTPCMCNKVRVIEALLRHGADPNKKFTFRSRVDERHIEADIVALMYATSPEAVWLLLQAGAEVDATNAIGTTALMYASSQGHCDVVRVLLEAGASPLVRQIKRPHHKARSARDFVEDKVSFWEKFTVDSNRERVATILERYREARRLLLEAEGSTDQEAIPRGI